jgi:hypothetical protein
MMGVCCGTMAHLDDRQPIMQPLDARCFMMLETERRRGVTRKENSKHLTFGAMHPICVKIVLSMDETIETRGIDRIFIRHGIGQWTDDITNALCTLTPFSLYAYDGRNERKVDVHDGDDCLDILEGIVVSSHHWMVMSVGTPSGFFMVDFSRVHHLQIENSGCTNVLMVWIKEMGPAVVASVHQAIDIFQATRILQKTMQFAKQPKIIVVKPTPILVSVT